MPVAPLFCTAGRCANTDGERPLHTDDDHLSGPAAQLVADRVTQAVLQLRGAGGTRRLP